MIELLKKETLDYALSNRIIGWKGNFEDTFESLPHQLKNKFEMMEGVKNFDQILNIYGFGDIHSARISMDIKTKLHNLYGLLDNKDEEQFIMNILNEKSENSFIVGGAIRDSIAGFEVKDFDFVTDTPIEDLKEEFSKFPEISFKDVGEHFKVLMVTINAKSFEIANFRKDLDHNGQGATNVEIGTFDDDWQRRDFRFNAIYFNPTTMELRDPTKNGIDDAYSKTINFIGNPDKRIDEDAIRLLRVLKFKKKGFYPSPKTLSAFRSNFHKICNAHSERIRTHLEDLVDLVKNTNTQED